jgi:hypothetical protein
LTFLVNAEHLEHFNKSINFIGLVNCSDLAAWMELDRGNKSRVCGAKVTEFHIKFVGQNDDLLTQGETVKKRLIKSENSSRTQAK